MTPELPAKATVVATTAEGHRWIELFTAEEAMYAERQSRTAVGVFMRHEIELNRDRALPHRWFMLLDKDMTKAHVVMCLPGNPEGFMPYDKPVHIVGFQNANAYPEFEDAINLLGAVIDMKIPRNYSGRDLMDNEARDLPPSKL
jgi:hypothetical protein